MNAAEIPLPVKSWQKDPSSKMIVAHEETSA